LHGRRDIRRHRVDLRDSRVHQSLGWNGHVRDCRLNALRNLIARFRHGYRRFRWLGHRGLAVDGGLVGFGGSVVEHVGKLRRVF
jgi:hypothetical protein